MKAPFLKPGNNGVWLSIKLQPRASSDQIAGVLGEELKIKVTAPPVDSAANQALVDLLADKIGCSRGQVSIVRGQASRHKLVWVSDVTVETVLTTLNALI